MPVSACHVDKKVVDSFLSEFTLDNPNLSASELSSLRDTLYANRDVFVTDKSPALGKTSLVEHTILCA